jgi:mono/diheme cytochrome c family protein
MAAMCSLATPAHAEDTADFSKSSGAELYERFCASCHGRSGEGDGPVASFFKLSPPDLTRIAQRNRGQFPEDRIRKIVDGRENVLPHGTREMPVWGWEFFFEEGGFRKEGNRAVEARKQTDEIIRKLVDHLRSIQKTDGDTAPR